MNPTTNPISKKFLKFAAAMLALAGLGAAGAIPAANPAAAQSTPAKAANPCAPKNPLNPCAPGHIRAPDAAHGLSPEAAEKAYRALKRKMARAFDLSGVAEVKGYQRWKRYNKAPYESSQHGDRYLNNYANKRSQAYGKYEQIGKMPRGSVIAKDSFTVLKDGRRLPGPMFLMEKMEAGFRPDFGDWRYTMILPDGSIVGVTGGEGTENMDYCGACHAQVAEDQDHLFFLPKDYRNNTN